MKSNGKSRFGIVDRVARRVPIMTSNGKSRVKTRESGGYPMMHGRSSCPRGWSTALLACSIALSSLTAQSKDADADNARKGVGVQGRWLTRDGQVWLPRGVGLGAFTHAPWYRNPDHDARLGFDGAAANFGPSILHAAKTWRVDSIRFLVSQPGLDPQSHLYSGAYVEALTRGVQLCLDEGFVVIIAMQDQKHSGETDVKPLPTSHTLRAWDVIGPAFANHPYVIFEIFNEPGTVAQRNWALNRKLWLEGGEHTGRNGKQRRYIGHQTILDRFREHGWRNVVIVDTMPWAQRVDREALSVRDSLNRLAFAVHPYTGVAGTTRAEWDARFGDVSENAVVLVTEWFTNTKAPFHARRQDLPEICEDFLAYLREKEIPLWAFAFDIPGTIVRDHRGTPNNWNRLRAGDVTWGKAGAGCGQQVRRHFEMLADRPLAAPVRKSLPKRPQN